MFNPILYDFLEPKERHFGFLCHFEFQHHILKFANIANIIIELVF